jgi:hypothetical protein
MDSHVGSRKIMFLEVLIALDLGIPMFRKVCIDTEDV